MPPFRGLDEHDHAYKAAAVAGGDWGWDHERAPGGWGAFMDVPEDMVEAARPICEKLPYTDSDNCVGRPSDRSGFVSVATSASHYNPAYYAVVGTAAAPFEGVAALYAMRAAASIICAILLGLATLALRRWARSSWVMAGWLLVLIPMATYTCSVAAPNGLELAAALLVWTSLLGIAARGPEPGLVMLAVTGAVPLVLVRGMGPVWLVLIVSTVAILLRGEVWSRVLRSRSVWAGALVVAAATVAAAWWTSSAGATEIDSEIVFEDSPWPRVPRQWMLWFFQALAAFPARNEPAHPAVYTIGFLTWLCFVVLAVALARWRERIALGFVLAAGSAVPIAMTVAVYAQLGLVWQGRYAYPFVAGFFLICGFAIQRAGWPHARQARWPVWSATGVVIATSLIGQIGVLTAELRDSPLAGTGAWVEPGIPHVVALHVVAGVLLASGLIPRGRDLGDAEYPSGRGMAGRQLARPLRVGR
ncbi:DUF2142 domain-containing protein [Nocardioides coralli]|nr:DUF2142 domain-containing protein [Nocardioides coralli]